MTAKHHASAKPGYPVAPREPKNAGPARTKNSPPGKVWEDPELRRQRIAHSAYLRAERRGFNGGSALQDWLDAEREIDDMPAGTAPGAS